MKVPSGAGTTQWWKWNILLNNGRYSEPTHRINKLKNVTLSKGNKLLGLRNTWGRNSDKIIFNIWKYYGGEQYTETIERRGNIKGENK